MKKRQKTRVTKISIPKESVIDKKPSDKENDIFSVHTVSSLEASSISSSSPSQLSAQDICFEPTLIRDRHTSDTWIDNEPSLGSLKREEEDKGPTNTSNTQEEENIPMKQDSQTSIDDSMSDSESTYSSETSSEFHIRNKPIEKKRNTLKYAKKTKLKWSIWQTVMRWFGKQTQDEALDA
ncbi:hypothetical protein Gasu2_68040 [Galdieria sulphuraria]|uniref:Uncharacterized protein n=1 Tax=Galdieria sulphuraria TaxID=130081 RepID=M2WYD4_GALSU|nr:uncharacterized protein Gasu_34590 [Galdieria sulphuraria]EME29065.1 hypothetical protein Gasu_34590 [Galdieria sulphuraria]GJD12730.1 hypothetical protein Gasu2_68040 [Galdieria sulphuraria]|eukprot:XP_005705585.1 hypothetical protein Gasu_34590 [Galdieria sulphuraria]